MNIQEQITDLDYKLLKYLSSNSKILVGVFQEYTSDVPVIRCRYERLLNAGLVKQHNNYICLTPLGQTALEDYLLQKSTEESLQKRSTWVTWCAVASTIASIASAICAYISTFR